MEDITTFSELIDKLITVDIKLFNLMDKTAELNMKEKTNEDIKLLVELSGENIRLATYRSSLKTAIDKKLNYAIKNGATDILDECKKYGK
jgi:hypothetical protein